MIKCVCVNLNFRLVFGCGNAMCGARGELIEFNKCFYLDIAPFFSCPDRLLTLNWTCHGFPLYVSPVCMCVQGSTQRACNKSR